MKFEWDEKKNLANAKKHGVTFEAATFAFNDPRCVVFENGVFDGELRESLIGNAAGLLLILVVFTDRNEKIRIISARLANKYEQEVYKNENR